MAGKKKRIKKFPCIFQKALFLNWRLLDVQEQVCLHQKKAFNNGDLSRITIADEVWEPAGKLTTQLDEDVCHTTVFTINS